MPSSKTEAGHIVIRGAREHNLKNINVNIPRNALTVITGLSGSGKSSLAFDTLYAEGQRRYVESLSAYARQFLGQMDKPDVDLIEGLSPAISIEQKTVNKNPRSTVGTATEILDYLRLLYARVGVPHCPKCGRPIQAQTPQEIVDRLNSLPPGTRLMLLAPLVDSRKGEHQKLFDRLRRDAFTKVRVGGEIYDLTEEIVLDKRKKHDIEVVLDRIIIKDGVKRRLTEAVELGLRTSGGTLIGAVMGTDGAILEELFFSQRFSCDYCGVSIPELTPQLFSFNGPQGACPNCDGLGANIFFDPDLIIPDTSLSLMEGAVAAWFRNGGGYYQSQLESLFAHYKWDLSAPFTSLPKGALDIILNGTGSKEIPFYFERDGHKHYFSRPFEGVLNNLDRRYHSTDSDSMKEDLSEFMSYQICPVCQGARLRPEALAVTVADLNLDQVCSLSITKCLDFFINIELSDRDLSIARRIIKEIRERLVFLNDVGLGYLNLGRSSTTLSGGETQRIRLATQIGSRLVGVMYVLDEPSIGLHQRDNEKLIGSLKKMRDLGNTVIVVEHDAETILSADHVLDLGPGAGENGGHVVFEGTPKALASDPHSLTGNYLSGRKLVGFSRERRLDDRKLTLTGATANNLNNLTLDFPLGVLTCVTGVSGSGKSTLVLETLYKTMANKLHRTRHRTGEYADLTGLEHVDKVIDIDQSPIGRTPRSNPATYIGLFTTIRDLFSRLPEARARGYLPGRFSFNVRGGRCEKCQGDGIIKIEMHFLPDVYIRCEACQGRRYNRDTLEIQYSGASIADVLDMTVSEAVKFFKNIPALSEKLNVINDVGLGYVRLGQAGTTLSGGEAQRVKLSKELSRRSTGRTVYFMDEPTTGLHFDDINKLLEVLQRLVDQGNTVIVIEHNLDVIKSADYVIDLGPEGGDGGGTLVTYGTPWQVAQTPGSHTGRFLKAAFNRVGS
ncbi:MAG: excinuclease ABC subunit UvrA [Deltaproteobacteria bacterium]|jgi:excinuclease ABC subunit A|nr:excinuclease ABC subunit UvrA [Deltaproteobacteria bacterium]